MQCPPGAVATEDDLPGVRPGGGAGGGLLQGVGLAGHLGVLLHSLHAHYRLLQVSRHPGDPVHREVAGQRVS